MDIKELCHLTGISPRKVRYLISLSIIPPPNGVSRSAKYTDIHVDGINRYKALESSGMNAASVSVRAQRQATLMISPGVVISIDQNILTNGIDKKKFKKRVSKAIDSLLEGVEDAK